MGTSSSGVGPGNNTPLLPNWAQDNDDDEKGNDNEENDDKKDKSEDSEDQKNIVPTNEPITTGNWGSVKATLGKFINDNKGSSLNNVGRAYVKNLGGARNATYGARAGVSTGGDYANFLSTISGVGIEKTLTKYGLSDLIGKSPEEIFANLSNFLAPAGNTNEDAIARKALLASLENLYDNFVEESGDIKALNTLSEKDLENAMEVYVSSYIFYKWLYELGLAIENKQINETQAIQREVEIKEFVKESVKVEIKRRTITTTNFKNGAGKKIIQDIFEQAYSTISL